LVDESTAAPASVRPAAAGSDGDGAAGRDPAQPVIVLASAGTRVEHGLVEQWTRRERPGAEVINPRDPALAQRLERSDDPLLVPVRVAWLPRERDGDRRARMSDLLLLANPRRPRVRAQARIARKDPDRVRVVVGEPAPASDLRRRWRAEAGGRGGSAGLAAFVARQALLACERAERAVTGDRYKVPRLVAEQIMDSARFRARVAQVSVELGQPEDEVLAYARKCLEEITAVQSRLALDVFRAVMSPMHARAWTVEADLDGLERLRELNRRYALVFLPSHRSYADPLVLGTVLHDQDFPPNHILGGANLSFWPLGGLGKRAGVVFIRRTFGDDAVYKLAVREYFGHLVAKRFNLEWYMEGGRTRTGKLRPPRYGLLNYLVAALDDGRADDVMLVPTSIVYDQLQEVGLMAAEQSGAAKKGEGLKWLADYMRAQRRNVGVAQVRFGEPLSLRQTLTEAGEENRLGKVAFAVSVGINRATPISATSLVTLALLDVRDRALTLDQVAAVLAPLLDDVERRGLPGSGLARLRRPPGLKRVLERLVAEKVVTCYTGGTEPVYSIQPGQHHVAAFYRNGSVHWFVNRAIVELSTLHVAEVGGGGFADGFEEALRLRDLLKFEFFFADKREFRDQLRAELDLVDPNWTVRARTPEDAMDLLASSGSLLAHRVLRSFFDAQLVVAERLAVRDPRSPVEADAFLKECIGVGRQMLLQARIHGPEAVSRELFAGALKLAANRDLVDPGREELRERREAFLAEVRDVVARVERIGEVDAQIRGKALDREEERLSTDT
jgi:glycerol-3-phosphate O-acyltransferase